MIKELKEVIESGVQLKAKIEGLATDIAKDSEKGKDEKKRIEHLANFVLDKLIFSSNRQLQELPVMIQKSVEPQNKSTIGSYFINLLQNQNQFENAAIDFYDPEIKKTIENEVYKTETQWQRFKHWYFGTDLHCAIFDKYVQPLMKEIARQNDSIPEDWNTQPLYQDLYNFFAQLFILAQQEDSGICWQIAIEVITNPNNTFSNTSKSFFLQVMADSALINYLTLYETNQKAIAEIQKSYAQKTKATLQKYSSYLTNPWNLYFLVEAAMALRGFNQDAYTKFEDNLESFIKEAGIADQNIANQIALRIKNIINNPSFLAKLQLGTRRIPSQGISFSKAALLVGGTVVAAGIITLGANFGEIKKDFGAARAQGIMQAIGSGFMSSGRILYRGAQQFWSGLRSRVR